MEQTAKYPVAREPAPDASQPDLEPIAHVLHRSVAELSRLNGLLMEMEETVACLLRADGNQDAVQRLQNIDILGQSITELSGFLQALADSARPSWLVCAAPAAQKVRLSSLAARLGPHRDSGAQNGAFASDEAEIFT